MSLSIVTGNKIIDHLTGKTAFALPQAFVGLSSTLPTAAGTNITEPSGGNYNRVATTSATWNAASNNSTTNATAVTFPVANADWLAGANLAYVVMFDAASGGNFLHWGTIAVPKDVLSGDQATMIPGSITITVS